MTTRTIKVDYLARVEGEGALLLKLKGEDVEAVELKIFEPPRYFEAFLRGRKQTEAPDITARICGICPVAYQMSSCAAIENALGIDVGPEIRSLRRLLYCGEWLESHILHMVMLHAPDFLGVPDSITLAKMHPERVKAALRMKKAGNAIVARLGGREIHPVNVRVGGFYRAPSKAELQSLLDELRWALAAAEETLDWMATFSFPKFERDYEFVSMKHETEYPLTQGRIVSSKGIDIDVSDYDSHFIESHVHYTHALQTNIVGRGAPFCGPLARINLAFEQLPPRAMQAAERCGLVPPCNNPYRSLLARGVEVIFAFDEAIRLIENYVPPEKPFVEVLQRSATGFGCTEAPRGILYHRYSVDDEGLITDAKIVPPTSQNQLCIEEDLRAMGKELARMSEQDATARAEHAIRNYDPCISCATHFLKLKIERSNECA